MPTTPFCGALTYWPLTENSSRAFSHAFPMAKPSLPHKINCANADICHKVATAVNRSFKYLLQFQQNNHERAMPPSRKTEQRRRPQDKQEDRMTSRLVNDFTASEWSGDGGCLD